MSKSNNYEKQPLSLSPTAPPQTNAAYDAEQFSQRAPPPTYEESIQMARAAARQPPPPQYYGMQPPNQMPAYGYVYPYVNNAQQQHQLYYQPMPMAVPYAPISAATYHQNNAVATNGNSPKVLNLAKGAEVRTAATGAISIPPPPPGCAPTPAQMAAMQGQPVLVKKKKNSFF